MENLLRNVNLEVDGRAYPRKVKTVSPPNLSILTEQYRAGGMDSSVDIDMGLEQLEPAFTMSSVDAELLAHFGLVSEKAVSLAFRGALRDDSGAVRPVVVHMRGQVKQVDWGDWEPGSTSETKYMVSARYYKFEHDGRVVHEIDVENMVRIIDGVDQLAEMRQALGL